MKKIMVAKLTENRQMDINGDAYEIQASFECENSSECFDDYGDDPIIDYVENIISNSGADGEYEWDLKGNHFISTKDFSIGPISHVLFVGGIPSAMYWVED